MLYIFDPTHNKTNTKELNISELNQLFLYYNLKYRKQQAEKTTLIYICGCVMCCIVFHYKL